jgi:hypothetical protein
LVPVQLPGGRAVEQSDITSVEELSSSLYSAKSRAIAEAAMGELAVKDRLNGLWCSAASTERMLRAMIRDGAARVYGTVYGHILWSQTRLTWSLKSAREVLKYKKQKAEKLRSGAQAVFVVFR